MSHIFLSAILTFPTQTPSEGIPEQRINGLRMKSKQDLRETRFQVWGPTIEKGIVGQKGIVGHLVKPCSKDQLFLGRQALIQGAGIVELIQKLRACEHLRHEKLQQAK